ncbi:phosphotransferase [Bacillus sp. ISL-35]|uniref:phosphotransferase enzyme family protein n=1 Tax=Bacillus sp. ISL-35 TaxID=2819122 RepID=UPI001BE6083B|nr:phosphotransferase [Bacillus sp. ISL-35]MBT2680138.1 phosphotransferase [Bacillus sp. ISL-35]MBT2704412.1 phosphotransferase [Chryseobacterium sp. ISL-80]
MMKLTTMQKVVETVNDEWKSTLAEEILEMWGHDPGSVYYFRASSNFLFVFKKAGKRYFLRFSDAEEKAYSHIESEMKILDYLRKQSIRVALPVKSLNGNFIERVETNSGMYYAVVFDALPGKPLEIEDLEEADFLNWGNHLGKLHRIFKQMPSEYRDGRQSWQNQLSTAHKKLPTQEKAALMELSTINQWAKGLPVTNDHFGLIHYDFELDNLSWMDEELGMLDFDDSMNHWFVADIAFALRDILKTSDDLENPFVKAFITGYQSETTLDRQLVHEIPMFIRMHNIITFVKLLQIAEVPDGFTLTEGLLNLKAKLENYIQMYRDSFKA